VSPTQHPAPPEHEAPFAVQLSQTSCAHVPLQQSENVWQVPPPATHAPETQRSLPLQESDPVQLALHSHVVPTQDSPVLQPPGQLPVPVPLPGFVVEELEPDPGDTWQSSVASSFASVVAHVLSTPAATTASHPEGLRRLAQHTLRLAHAVPVVPVPVPVPMGIVVVHCPLVEYIRYCVVQVDELPPLTTALHRSCVTPVGMAAQQVWSSVQSPLVAGVLEELHAAKPLTEARTASTANETCLNMPPYLAHIRRPWTSPAWMTSAPGRN
jgi:hypothetical protein